MGASNLLNIPSSGIITGTTIGDSVSKKLAIKSEVDESTKVHQQDNLSTFDKRKIEVHPDDAKKQDKKNQEAKKNQEQTQALMQEAWAPEASAESRTDGLENNKNKLSSDEAMSLKMADVTQKESEDVKPSTPSQPDVHKAIERADEVTLQELEKKQISQDELSSKLEQDATSKSKLSMEQQELATAEISVAVDLKSSSDQQKLVTSDNSINGEHVSATDQQNLAIDNNLQSKKDITNLEQDATSKSKLTTEQQELTTAEQKLVTSDSSINGEHVSATDQRELAIDKNLKSKEDLSKPTPTDISQQKSEEVSRPISQQSPSEETINSEALAIQQAEKEFKSAVKTIKEESEKVVPDKSVKPKTSTVKKEVSEKQGSKSGESSSLAKLDIQSTTSSKKKKKKKKKSTCVDTTA